MPLRALFRCCFPRVEEPERFEPPRESGFPLADLRDGAEYSEWLPTDYSRFLIIQIPVLVSFHFFWIDALFDMQAHSGDEGE
jgi:hypothetical protein